MALLEALEELARTWDEVTAALSGAAREEALAVARRYSTADHDERIDLALELVELISGELPREHPFRRALARDGHLMTETAVLEEALLLLADELAGWTPEQALRLAKEALLAAPSLDDREARAEDGAPLVRLPAFDGTVRLPSFQFTGTGRPRAVVLRINTLLGAAEDPWGVASWWLRPSGSLGAAPAELLDIVADDTLYLLASSILEEGD